MAGPRAGRGSCAASHLDPIQQEGSSGDHTIGFPCDIADLAYGQPVVDTG